MKGFARTCCLLGLLLCAASARAETRAFALIVTNNRSAELNRPDLQFADDDGARYYRLFRALAGESHVALLTAFDRASADLYPELVRVAQPPRRRELDGAVATLEARIAEARAEGHQTVFYFVYAGHGDVHKGRGYLDLEDARIDASFLEHHVVERIGADQQHLILDSCNSFFVLHPRKPGGRRWATPKDMEFGFAERHANVGMFLSTNSEQDVYEWSTLESGIFSYEVRSGLSGAADADRDGSVSYTELGAYIETANRRIVSQQFRPHIYFRGPGGNTSAALFAWNALKGVTVELNETPRRLWVSNQHGQRLVDLNKEVGPMRLTVPASPGEELVVRETVAPEQAGRPPSLRQYDLPAGSASIALAALSPRAPLGQDRGSDTLLDQLFQVPYGPIALASYLKERSGGSEPVFGISRADGERMRHYLSALSESDGRDRQARAIASFGVAGVFGAVAAATYVDGDHVGAGLLTAGALVMAAPGVLALTSGSYGEQALEAYDAARAREDRDADAIVAATELKLEELAASERRARLTMAWSMVSFGGIATIGMTTALIASPSFRRDLDPGSLISMYGSGALLIGIGLLSATTPTPVERILSLYRRDSELHLQLGVPGAPGAIGIGLSGTF